jgi:hypothetical protein
MASETGKAPLPSGSWTHSYEEDEGPVRVYRPTDAFAFPPTRAGRETLQFNANGELIRQVPGPDDRPVDSASHWSALGENRVGMGGMPGAPEAVFEVIEYGPAVLKLRKR